MASTELELHEEQGSITLFHTDDPAEIVTRASAVASVLAKVIREKHLTAQIGGKEHVVVEGWTLLGTMLGVFPVCDWSRELEDGMGWEARVEARTRDGSVVGAAEAMCSRKESRWRSADDYAIRSMAQTRATSKALRQPLGFIMSLAGYEATPVEEMPSTAPAPRQRGRGQSAFVAPQKGDTIVHTALKDMLDVVDSDKHPEWQAETVIKNARSSFGRTDIASIDDLTQSEAEAMLAALTPYVEVQDA